MFFKWIFRARAKGRHARVRSGSGAKVNTLRIQHPVGNTPGQWGSAGGPRRKFERLADRRRWKKSRRVDTHPRELISCALGSCFPPIAVSTRLPLRQQRAHALSHLPISCPWHPRFGYSRPTLNRHAQLLADFIADL